MPQVEGPGVPAAAVQTDASGGTYVVDAQGTKRPVSVEASGDGIAIVSGLKIGDQVIVVNGAIAGASATATGTGDGS